MSECGENCNCQNNCCSEVEQPKEILTEVTSVAKEEEKTGQPIKMPSAEEVVNRAGASFITNMQRLLGLIKARQGGGYKISRKGMNRVMNAILSLPAEDMPVKLEGKDEQLAFALGQRLIADRFILLQHYITTEMKKQQAQQQEQKVEEQVVSQETQVVETTENKEE